MKKHHFKRAHFLSGFRDKTFLRTVMAIALPIMIQQGITNFVSLLDNIMVGSLCTESMSGVSIVNQFMFIFYLTVFGAISAAGIFTAQFHGLEDTEGERYTFRFKVLIVAVASVIGLVVFFFLDEPLINLFLHDGSVEGDLALTMQEGKDYLRVMLIGLIPYALSQVYASTLRETGETVVPMAASVVAVATNFILNLVLIFGYLGAPALGVVGAAIATVISRFAEIAVLLIYTHTHGKKHPFIRGAYRSFRVPKTLCVEIILRGLPLMANECLWAIGVTMRNQCYSTRGLDAVAAQNISSTIFNVFSVVYMAMGNAIAIIIGNLLGAGDLEEAQKSDRKLLAFSVLCGALMGGIMAATSALFPLMFNTTETVRGLSTYMMIIGGISMPFCAFANAAYFTIRSGGKVLVTMLFDSVFTWVIVMPLCFILAYLTGMPIEPLYAIGQLTEILKSGLGLILLRRKAWVRQLVNDNALKK